MNNLLKEIETCEIWVDEEGEWYHKNRPIIRRDILKILLESTKEVNNDFILEVGEQKCRIEVADTPFVITRVDYIKKKNGVAVEKLMIRLKYINEIEELPVFTIWQNKNNNIIYCKIPNKGRARFSRAAYYQLANFIEEENGHFFIMLNNKKYYIESR